ncbi:MULTISPECIES: 4-alpha-glucanotransferase [unclassified Oceanobacter]|uniref:4-alpha-glucanotransferase n=2 Tax=Gammaproteobacteria TaxID=1236 RepID=UPI0026E12233|nr:MULTISPECIES: 4-alpha-glucanotransferase [unclassified Oceanobacter]MDO6681712.1 4-alpha-glucanotransferase [Oceanobacter sp. 5_MG-2023]MDP2505660.1 4-alpha-glucanotransferase [Oceanobacter sp. 3_MG-2023]MDP2547513.1 4-alpha-glucanotransferase [Oceanobacter sp. 4_MG-2023]MDP2608301.1 4-alpha-glucanotransferase [Oceanobacter sp. 1_MG-2023]MDP2612186.1 4-alpha-glucanotransferase [Oceanobacter sp. 2_MG-2023]
MANTTASTAPKIQPDPRSRCAGVLLHPTSLPSGKLDESAWLFLDWMQAAHLTVWQMLPLMEPLDGLSPYQGVSAFALNPALLPDHWQNQIDPQALAAFIANPPHWLQPYARFTLLKQLHDGSAWNQWPDVYKFRDPQALADLDQHYADELHAIVSQQFALIQCWQQLKHAANTRGIQLFGDMPIFVAYDSVDVWSNPDEFKLDDNLNPTVVTGVPPDYFSATGQRWGNPHYHWPHMEANGFYWWRQRMAWSLELFDLVRIDHFRGLEASWEIAVSEPTAMTGNWVKAPGHALLSALQATHDPLPVIAEDLGIITPEVVALKEAFGLPGMSVLQFGFNGLPDNPHALTEQVENSVVYTGTHDNETTLGWWQALQDDGQKHWILSQLDLHVGEMPWPLIDAALQSPAYMAIMPLQDFLGLDNQSRMNTPGTIVDNWHWRYQPQQLTEALAQRIATLVDRCERYPAEQEKQKPHD